MKERKECEEGTKPKAIGGEKKKKRLTKKKITERAALRPLTRRERQHFCRGGGRTRGPGQADGPKIQKERSPAWGKTPGVV